MKSEKKYIFRMSKAHCFIVFGLLLGASVSAQQKNLDTIQVINVGSYNVTIHDASKLKDNPLNDDSSKVMPALDYKISSRQATTVYAPSPLDPPHMIGEPLRRLYKLYVKAGFGNYTTPYGELFFNNLRSKDLSYGIHFRHQSSTATLENKGFSGYSDNDLNLYGKRFIRKHTLSSELDYNRNVVHCYGYDVSENFIDHDATRNLFQNISIGVGLQSHFKDSSSFNHTVAVKYSNFTDNHNSAENNIFASADVHTHYLGQLFSLNASVNYFNNRLVYDTTSDMIVKVAPSIRVNSGKFALMLSTGIAADIASRTTYHFIPGFEINYDIIDHIIIPYGGVRSGYDHNSYRSLSYENPFVRPDLDLRNTFTKYELYGGLRGSLTDNMNYNVRTSYSKIDDLYFFVNDFSEVLMNRFKVVYDSVTAINFHAELGYKKKEKLGFVFKGDYFKYNMSHQAQAWHRPQMKLTFTANYNLKDKIMLHADIFVIGKQLAPKPPQDSSSYNFIELRGVTDINIGLQYRYNKKLSGFANFNNIGSFRYERWENYPMQRFNFMAGLTYSL